MTPALSRKHLSLSLRVEITALCLHCFSDTGDPAMMSVCTGLDTYLTRSLWAFEDKLVILLYLANLSLWLSTALEILHFHVFLELSFRFLEQRLSTFLTWRPLTVQHSPLSTLCLCPMTVCANYGCNFL